VGDSKLSFHFRPGPFSMVTARPWQLVLCCLEARLLKGGHCHVPCHFFIFPFIFIHSHSFPLFISTFRYSFPFSVHSPVSDSSAHVSGLLSVLQVPYISRVLVLERSRIITCTVSLFRRFTLATISYGAPFVITCSLLPCSGLVRPSSFHMYLLPFASGCHFSFTI